MRSHRFTVNISELFIKQSDLLSFMGFFNHLFGNKSSIAREVGLDAQKRPQIWRQHVANYPQKAELSKLFSPGNIDRALQDLNALDKVLERIEGLIDRDLIDIEGEEKTEDEILADLGKLANAGDSLWLVDRIFEEVDTQKALLAIFKRIHDVLKVELHSLRLIRQKIRQGQGNIREPLLQLFRLIFHEETFLYEKFTPGYILNKLLADKVDRIAAAVLLEEEFKEEVQSDEDKFVWKMVRIFGKEDSEHHYRKLGEAIYLDLAHIAGASMLSGADLEKGIRRLERLMRSDRVMFDVIKHQRPKYSDERIRWVMRAFREAYRLGHFIELESEFAT